MTQIPKIEIKEVYVPKIKTWEVQPPILDLITKPVVDIQDVLMLIEII